MKCNAAAHAPKLKTGSSSRGRAFTNGDTFVQMGDSFMLCAPLLFRSISATAGEGSAAGKGNKTLRNGQRNRCVARGRSDPHRLRRRLGEQRGGPVRRSAE